MSLKNPVTPPGIDPGTVRLVAQRLNHYATPGRSVVCVDKKIYSRIPFIRINRDGEPSVYTENPDNLIFLFT